jgi:predicted RNA-binding protein YlxR (DUF448 family)
MFDRVMKCHCGSGEDSEVQYDGRGIYLCRTCSKCHERKMATYNPVILEYYTQEDVDEPIEPEEW